MRASNRIEQLRHVLEQTTRTQNQRILLSEQDQRNFARIAFDSFSESRGRTQIERKAQFLADLSERWPYRIGENELIVGSQKFGMHHWRSFLTPEQQAEMDCTGNIGHIIVDYGRMVRLGVGGIRKLLRAQPEGKNTKAFETALDAFSRFIRRHSEVAINECKLCQDAQRQRDLWNVWEICSGIENNPPEHFWPGLQLVWFMQVFLHAEGHSAAVSLGRFDQYLWPLLEKDLRTGVIMMEQAEELLSCFWLKCCEGDESQNLTLGGVDAEGRMAENPLTLLCLKVAATLKLWQPSISVRIAPDTSPAFWQAVLELAGVGIGQPSYFNDPVVTDALEALDIPRERARDWGIVGCYEATPQGDTYGMTVAGQWNLAEELLTFLRMERREETFEDFFRALKSHFQAGYAERLKAFQSCWDHQKTAWASPFESACLTGCIESGRAAQEGGGRFTLFGVNMLGLGTIVDSLAAIRELVFEKKSISLGSLCGQLAGDFSDEPLRLACRNLPGKYGTDTPASNILAEELSRYLSGLVLAGRIEDPFATVRPSPGFFWFGGDIHQHTGATPDGRRSTDTLSYGCGPGTMSRETSTASILNSTARLAHCQCPCGNPLTISLHRQDAAGAQGRELLQQIVKSYFRMGGFHLHFNIVDAEKLRQAQREPEKFSDLTVRISGFSAKFQTLDKRWQDAIIERTERGM